MKIALLTNILTPYRCFFFDKIHEKLKREGGDFKVFVMTDSLPLRPWTYKDLSRDYTVLLKGYNFAFKNLEFIFNPSVSHAIKTFHPDVVIVAGSWTYPTTWHLLLANKLKRISPIFFWTESHNHTGINNQSKTSRLVKFIKQLALKLFDGYCVPGKFAQENIQEQINASDKKFIHLPNLIDNEYYSVALAIRKNKNALRERHNIDSKAFVFFTPARMVEVKGQIPFFTNVVNAVKNRNVTFVLAGEGPDKARIESIAIKNMLDIRIYPYQDQSQIREWLAMADAFLLPSLSDPNPLSNIEAAWAGLPLCISCYVGNGPELVEDGVNGVIFDTLNKASISNRINYVFERGYDWLASAGNNSLQKAKDSFEGTIETEKFIANLHHILKI